MVAMHVPPRNANPDEKQDNADVREVNAVWMALMLEGLLVAVAIGLSFLQIYDHAQPLEATGKQLFETYLPWGWLGWGVVAAIPMVLQLALLHAWRPRFYQPMENLVRDFLQPMFERSSWVELAIISLSAGFGEELLFRWCLQGGIEHWIAGSLGAMLATAIAIAISSVIFGLCHYVNWTYFVFAMLAGIYFGIVMAVSHSWVVCAVGHAVFDFVAFVYIQRRRFT
jgi:membrane protease YdiL (CAAX protease family)